MGCGSSSTVRVEDPNIEVHPNSSPSPATAAPHSVAKHTAEKNVGPPETHPTQAGASPQKTPATANSQQDENTQASKKTDIKGAPVARDTKNSPKIDKKVAPLVAALLQQRDQPHEHTLPAVRELLAVNVGAIIPLLEAAAKKSPDLWLEGIMQGLVILLEGVCKKALENARDYAQELDPESPKDRMEGHIGKLLRSGIETWQDNTGQNIGSPVSAADVNGRAMILVNSLYAVRTRHGRSYQLLSEPLNFTLRLLCAATWQGDAVAGGRAGAGGIPEWLFRVFSECLGLDKSCLLLLDGSTKSILAHRGLLLACAGGIGNNAPKITLTVSRANILQDSLAALLKKGAIPTPGGVSSSKHLSSILSPHFVSAAGGRGGGKYAAGVEEGEGHGPRKEFFSLVSMQFGAQFGSETVGLGLLSGSEGQDILVGKDLHKYLRPGYVK